MATKWAIHTVNRELALLSPAVREYIDNNELAAIAAPRTRQAESGFLTWMVAALGSFFRGEQCPGFLLPLGPNFRRAKALTVREKAWLEAYWRFGPFV